MIKINDRDVNEYFKDKDIAEKLVEFSGVLLSAHFLIEDMEPTLKDALHFAEALYLFSALNASNIDEEILESEFKNCLKKINVFKSAEDDCVFSVSLDNEMKPLEALYWLEKNRDRLKEEMFILNQCWLATFRNAKDLTKLAFALEDYMATAMLLTAVYLENFTGENPYSAMTMKVLFRFCKQNSPFSEHSKEDMDYLCAGNNTQEVSGKKS